MIGSYVAANHFWTDIGTPADYLQLHADLLAHKVPVYEELAETAAAAPFIGLKSASVSPDATLLGWVCIGDGAAVEAGTTLQRTVVWDNAVVPAGSTIIDGIVTA